MPTKLTVVLLCISVCGSSLAETNPPDGFVEWTGGPLISEKESRRDALEQRIQQVRDDAIVEEERVRAGRESSKRLSEQNNQPQKVSAQDRSDVPEWPQISRSEKFSKLSNAEKQRVKAEYFEDVIARRAVEKGEDLAAARDKFMNEKHPGEPDLSMYEDMVMGAKQYWPYAVAVAVLIGLSIFYKRVAYTFRYLIDNAFKLAALSAAVALLAYTARLIRWMF